MKINKVINVPMTAGIIGALGLSPQHLLNKAIQKANAEGWQVGSVIEAKSGNLFLLLLRLALLVVTLGFYTTANGYYIILSKEVEEIAEGMEHDESGEALPAIQEEIPTDALFD